MKPIHRLIRPYIWWELPGWSRLYEHLVGDFRRDKDWAREPPRIIVGKLHGYQVKLELSQWSERMTYFLGRFYDIETQLLMSQVLMAGDRFVDIGANIGMISLLGAKLVGRTGVVDAFEPNPGCVARLCSFIADNAIENVRVHPIALGSTTSIMALWVPRINWGGGTLGRIDPNDANGPCDVIDVPVEFADARLAADQRPPVLIKIDVEGYEHQVLVGLAETITRHRPLITTEVIAAHLARSGHSVADLFQLMGEYGYEARSLIERRHGFGHRLELGEAHDRNHTRDVLWVPTDGPNRIRLENAVQMDRHRRSILR